MEIPNLSSQTTGQTNSQSSNASARKTFVGAEYQAQRGGTGFRLWAPICRSARVLFEDRRTPFPLEVEAEGYFSGFSSEVKPSDRYRFQVDAEEAFPDPASRHQPEGPHGYSEVVDSLAFSWSDDGWAGVELAGQIVYELHVGTFTREGTWLAAADRLAYLRETGVTLIEMMPVAEFPGKFGWGYDGVHPFAPASIYGRPDDLRQFVDRAHRLGIGVVLDVVYNHLGPDGNYLPKFSPYYLTEKNKTDWGPAINFDGENSLPVREYFLENAAYWIRDFHFDGLRLDATQDIHDGSRPHIITRIGQVARDAAGGRKILLIGENEPQNTALIRPVAEGGYGLDALWNDDFHHSAMVALTGKSEAYYSDYRGKPQEFVSAMKYGYLFQGQWYRWQKKRRGKSNLGLPRPAMVTFIQNHDQIANSAKGRRAQDLSTPGSLKALTALMLLGPGTPMLFQGQEFGASSPFLFFADQKPDLAKLIRQGREDFLEQWRSLKTPEMKKCLIDPCDEATFDRSKLDWSEVDTHPEQYALHRDLIELRRSDQVFSRQGEEGLDGAVLGEDTFVLRYFSAGFENDRLLVVNLGGDLEFNPAPEPLLAPPDGCRWSELWSSESTRYGGCGTARLDTEENWKIPGRAAVALHPTNENAL